jgi:glycine oxidase
VASPDVIIAGAGIIGVSIALELQERGATVLVLDRGELGQEASSAAAGMLAALDPETPVPLRALALESAGLFPDYVRKIEELSGMKVDFRRQGTISLLRNELAPPRYRLLSGEDLVRLEPALRPVTGTPRVPGSQALETLVAFYVEEASVDPPLLMRAALRAAASKGIEVRGHSEVKEIRSQAGRVAIVTSSDRLSSAVAVNCRGAWSGAPVRPRKGQMLSVGQPESASLEHVVVTPEVYMVPRSSGRIVIGATVEDVGFDKTVQAATIHTLHQAATRFVPDLEKAPVIESWAGLRPGSPDDLPLMGETETPRVFAATGHFRNGILLAPVTARIMANLINGKPAGMDISAFSPGRFVAA